MPRIVPSQVVALIDELFPHARTSPDFQVYSVHAPALSAIIRLIDEIPSQLITLGAPDYGRLVLGLEALREAIIRWRERGGNEPPSRINGAHPLLLVRGAVALCSDASPSPTTAGLTFITDDELRNNIRNDISAATSSLHNGEWKAATVLGGAVAEALLLWSIQDVPSDRLKTISKLPRGNIDRWHLGEFISVAERLGLIKRNTAAQAHLAKDFRNLIHPGRAQRLSEVCDRGTALTALASVELIVRDLSVGRTTSEP